MVQSPIFRLTETPIPIRCAEFIGGACYVVSQGGGKPRPGNYPLIQTPEALEV
jgi:hypothetical protein